MNACLAGLSARQDEGAGRAGGPSEFTLQARDLGAQFSTAGTRQMLALLLGSVLLVLAIAGANIATLQLVRTETRQRELAVRSARRVASTDPVTLVVVTIVLGIVATPAGCQRVEPAASTRCRH